MELHNVKTAEQLSKLLNCKISTLTFLAFVLSDDKKYRSYTIVKRGGGTRTITAPTSKLKEVQEHLLDAIRPYYQAKSCAHGYVEGKSIVTNAAKHVRQKLVARVDIKDFFNSINSSRVVGLLMSSPFDLPFKVAILIANLVTFKGSLPQGAPTSPIISNLICRRLDRKISVLAREARCYFTRYADDFFFSTNHSVMPSSLFAKGEDGELVTGDTLSSIFVEEGFEINDTKVSVKDRSQRQVVTGVVVNEKLNVPRTFIREVRAMLYSWEKHGLEAAEKFWSKNCDFRNRVSQSVPRFSWVLRGKVNHIGEVKGRSDKVYLGLAKRLAALDLNFELDSKLIKSSIADEIDMFTEGKTDELHVSSALDFFHSKGHFTRLKIKFQETKKGEGDSALEKLCNTLSALSQRKLTVLLFDRDVARITESMKGSATDYKDHGNNVFSLVLPSPSFVKSDSFCIEHCYQETLLKTTDEQGRRLYLANEFDKRNGIHNTEPHIFRVNPKKATLIVDTDVINISTRDNIALSKAKFAEYVRNKIRPFDVVDFEGFRPLFETLEEMKDKYSNLN